jgi:hypothetical protein
MTTIVFALVFVVVKGVAIISQAAGRHPSQAAVIILIAVVYTGAATWFGGRVGGRR